MICVPSLNQESGFGFGPRDLIHSLSTLLSSFRGGNPAVINILQQKLATLGLTVSSPQKLLDISSSDDERDEWLERTPRSITWGDGALYSHTTSPVSSTFPVGI